MNLTDELRKLADLREAGHLTEQEFTEAKRRLLGSVSAEPAAPAEAEPVAPDTEPEFEDRVFRSSRWSSGNKFFPDSLRVTKDGLVFRKGRFFGSGEERIAYRAIASVKLESGMFLADLSVETSGGSQPIFLNGLWKSDAREIQEIVSTMLERAPARGSRS